MNKYYLESDFDSVAYPRHRRYQRNTFESASPYRNKTNYSTIPRKLRLKSWLFDDDGEMLITEQLWNIHNDFEAWKSWCPGEIYKIRTECPKTPLARRMIGRNHTPEPPVRREAGACERVNDHYWVVNLENHERILDLENENFKLRRQI